MESINEDSHQRLNELIYDEDKIVTTTLLANELKISKCGAQDLLNAFIKDNKVRSNELHLTYLICGKLQDNKGVGIYLVEQNKLNDMRSLFDDISSEIIYSVQKGQHIDFNVIAATDLVYEQGSGPLISKNCVKRNLKSRKISSVQTSKSASKEPVTSSKKDIKNEKEMQNAPQENGKHSLQSSQKQNKGKQGGIATFFAKAASKPPQNGVKPLEDKTTIKQRVDVSIEQKSTASNEDKNSKEQTNNDKNKEQTNNDKKMDVDVQKDDDKVKEQSNNTKKRKKESKNKGPNKKRKRIQEICDSDSSDMFENDENEDIIEMSDDEPAPQPVAKHVPVPKNKKRKAVDKTYVDEEGFIVTTTEYVYETASEDEENDSVKKQSENRINTQKKASSFNMEAKPVAKKGQATKKQTNAKQPTLMSFFKKN